MAYAVRLEQFEGPLELLLRLIEREKLDVTRVSLTAVTDQYLEYIEKQTDVPLAQLAAFLSVASRLLLLKSRALLPLLEFTEAEEASLEDLEWQLREYQRFRDASVSLGLRFANGEQAAVRESFLGAEVCFLPAPGVTAESLASTFRAVLGEIPLLEVLEEEVIQDVLSLEEKMLEIRSTLARELELSFSQMTIDVKDKLEIIVAFLAMLELVKQRFIHAEQAESFQKIALRHETY